MHKHKALNDFSYQLSHKEPMRHTHLFIPAFYALLLCAVSILFYGAAGHDDSHITFSAVQQLNSTGSILNTNGMPIEQGSSLLHVVLFSGFSQLSAFIPGLSHLSLADIGMIFSLAAAMLCFPLAQKAGDLLGIKNPHIIPASLLLSLCFGYWANGGLETSLVSLTILIYTLCSFYILKSSLFNTTKPNYPIAFYSLYCLSAVAFIAVRPESIVVGLCFLLTLFTALLVSLYSDKQTSAHSPLSPSHLIKPARLLITPLVIGFIIITAWRYQTFGLFFPQPVAAKASGLSIQHSLLGFAYFAYSAQLSIIILSIVSAISALRLLIKPTALTAPHLLLICCLSFSVSYLAFIIASGGDWMLGGRFFAHIIILLLLSAFSIMQSFAQHKKWAYSLLSLLMIESVFFAYSLSTGVPANKHSEIKQQFETLNINIDHYAWVEKHNSVHLLDILFVDALSPLIESIQSNLILDNTEHKIHISSVQMGMTPYHLNALFPQQLYFIDMRGLTTQELSHCQTFDTYPRRQTGIYVSHAQYVQEARQKNCTLPLPDIIYDIASHNASFHKRSVKKLTQQGYTIVWQQKGGMSHGLQIGRVSANAYIAVSAAILNKLPEKLKHREQVFSFTY